MYPGGARGSRLSAKLYTSLTCVRTTPTFATTQVLRTPSGAGALFFSTREGM